MPSSTFRPDPYIVLLGCRPWSAAEEHKRNCPVCHGATSRESRTLMVCGRCNAASIPMNRVIAARELGGPETGRRQRAERVEQKIKTDLQRQHPTLDETERRLIWNGYRGVFCEPVKDPSNLAKVGRDLLRSIGQEPHWDLTVETMAVVDAAS